MGLVTRRELSEVLEGRDFETAPTLPPIPAYEPWVHRMHHPETSPRYPMRDFEFEILGERVKVIKGVATVSITVAKELEGRGWRRGATVERDMKEGALYEGDKSRAG